jgi:putative membrane protein
MSDPAPRPSALRFAATQQPAQYNPRDWWAVLVAIPTSPLFRLLALDMAIVAAYAALVVWLELEVITVSVPLGPQVLSLLGIILGLCLVFRTNSAYDRWWEGRRQWGQAVNTMRTLSQLLDAALPDDDPARARYASLLVRWPAALRERLRHWDGTIHPLMRTLARQVEHDAHRTAWPDATRRVILQQFVILHDVIGACERIRKSPIPQSYNTYIKQFILLFTLVLPVGLVDEFGYGAVLATVLIFFSTMGLDLLAMEIEDPFGTDASDLPLDDIVLTIENGVRESLAAGDGGAVTPA